MNIIVINDLHLGVQRVSGTTPTTAEALREYAVRQYERLLQQAVNEAGEGCHIFVNGDLTDRYDISLADALDVYEVTCRFLERYDLTRLAWSLGNHDLSKDSSNLGTVEFIGRLLQNQFLGQFFLVDKPTMFGEGAWELCPVDHAKGVYVIPHLVNQEKFDQALRNVPKNAEVVLLHCNFDNGFAAQADHSLNLSRAQAKTLIDNGAMVVLGHEHQHRNAFNGGLRVVGNQFPTSVADCLSNGEAQRDGKKHMLRVTDDDAYFIETWDRAGNYAALDWRDLDGSVSPDLKFIRVEGEATAEEAPEALRRISELRKSHQAFVITNAVKVQGQEDDAEIASSVEEIGKIDVLTLLKDFLTEAHAAKIDELLEMTR